jgi:hypothetical protein
VREPAALVAFAVAYGFSNGTKESIDASVWADFFGRTAVGAIRGLSRPFVVGSGALGTFAGGLAFDLTGGYGLAALAFAVVALLGAGASLAAAPPATRPGRAPGTLA